MKLGNGKQGIFKVTGGGKPRITMLHATGTGGSRVPAHPTFRPALKRLEPKVGGIMLKHIEAQLRRHKVWGY
jgi:hypothetical protein